MIMADNNTLIQLILNTAEKAYEAIISQGGGAVKALSEAGREAFEYALSLGIHEKDAHKLVGSAKELLITGLLKAGELQNVETLEVKWVQMYLEAEEAAHELFSQLKASGTLYPEALELSVNLAYKLVVDAGFQPGQAGDIAKKVRESLAEENIGSNSLAADVEVSAHLADWDGRGSRELEEELDLLPEGEGVLQGSDELADIIGVILGGTDEGVGGLPPGVLGGPGTPDDPTSPEDPDDDDDDDDDDETLPTPPTGPGGEDDEDNGVNTGPTPGAVVSISTLQTEVNESDDTETRLVTFTISRTNGVGESQVAWQVAGDVSGHDVGTVELPSGIVLFSEGEQSQTVSFTVADDYLIEGTEALVVQLLEPGEHLEIGAESSASILIRDDEVGFQISADSSAINEGAAGETIYATFTVTRSVDTDQAAIVSYRAIPYGATPASLGDFVGGQDALADNAGLPSGSVSFTVGETEKTITVELSGDNAAGPDEGFAVVLYDPPAGTLILTDTAPVNIINDDGLVSISIVDSIQDEGSTSSSAFQFTVTRTGSLLSATQVDYAVSPYGESQIQPGDIVGSEFSSGTVTFTEGQSQATVTIDIAGDSILEGNENFEVYLLNPGDNLEIQNGTAVATIRQDDSAISINALDAIRIEGNTEALVHTFEITRSGNINQTTVVNWQLQPGGDSPVDLADFGGSFPAGSVTFAVGESVKIISVTPTPDATYETSETYDVVLSLPDLGAVLLNSSARGNILNDEAGLTLSATSLALIEGDNSTTQFSFTITRSGTTDSVVSVDWFLSAGDTDGVQSADFDGATFPSGTVTFAKGVNSKIVSFFVATDSVVEANENFDITLSNPSVGADIIVGEVAGTIYNDDAGFAIETVDVEKTEGQAGDTLVTFKIIRSGDVGGTDSVAYSVTGDGGNPANADDFGGSFPSGTVIFDPGVTEKTFTVAVSADTQIESDEDFTVTLSSPSSGSGIVVGEESSTATILDDDDQFSIESVTTTVNEGGTNTGGTVIFNINRTGSLDTSSQIDWSVAGSGANASDAADFSAISGSVTFAIGETQKSVEVDLAGDYIIENDEGFTVTLENPTIGSTIGTASINGTIVNDDVGLAISTVTTNLAEGDSGIRHTPIP